MDINTDELSSLLDVIENVRRRKIVDKDYSEISYIDPLNYVSKLKVQNNHVISGRRGCGKTTIMLASMKDRKDYTPITIECQTYRRDDQEEILIKFIVKILENMQENICQEIDKEGLIGRLKENSKQKKEFYSILCSIVDSLNQLKSMPNSIQYKTKLKQTINETKEQNQNKGININGNLDGGYKFQKIGLKVNLLNNIVFNNVSTKTSKSQMSVEMKSEQINEISKDKLLDDLIETLAYIFNQYKLLTKKVISLYLDDFYQISSEKQVRIIQYLHDVYKNCENKSFCFKICTLPNRLKINYDNEIILSLKDDFSSINLDRNLSNIDATKEYLLQILSSLKKDLNIKPRDIEKLFSNKEALINLIIGSGGIPRDFLIMFVDVVNIVRANNEAKITKSAIYSVVNTMRIDKDENIEFDSDITIDMIEHAKQEIEDEIVTNRNTNVFLFSHNETDDKLALMRNLVNSRYLHIIKDNTSSENKKKEMFTAYLVDMSFYTNGKQKKRNFEDKPFWEKDSRSRFKYIESAPIFKFK